MAVGLALGDAEVGTAAALGDVDGVGVALRLCTRVGVAVALGVAAAVDSATVGVGLAGSLLGFGLGRLVVLPLGAADAGEVAGAGAETVGSVRGFAFDVPSCQDQATEPPAGIFNEPTPRLEYVHDEELPFAHHRLQ
jgi:hypothetical protein